MLHRFPVLSVWAAFSFSCLLHPSVSGAPVEFTVDETQSQITLAGSVAGFALREQGPGSLTTTFAGKILADVGAEGIQFTGGSTLTARTNGVWSPGPGGEGDPAPANFAAQASSFLGTVQGALRNLVLDLTSGVLPVENGQFDAAALLFAFPENSIASFDYDAGFLGSDGIALSGIGTNKIVNGATLAMVNGVQTLTIQVDTEFKFRALQSNDSTAHLTGKLVAVQGGADQLSIASIQIRGQEVILHVDGASEPRLESSPDLFNWSLRTPEESSDGGQRVLTLPLGGVQEFYRVSQ